MNQMPSGWVRKEVLRKSGVNKGKVDIHIISPKGKIFRSKDELSKYIAEKRLKLKMENFNFSSKRSAVNKNSDEEQSSIVDLSSSSESQSVSFSSTDSLESTTVSVIKNSVDPSSTLSSSNPVDTLSKNKMVIHEELLSNKWLSDFSLQPYLQLLDDRFLQAKQCTVVNPLIINGVKNCIDFHYLLEPLNIKDKNILIMAINDSEQITTVENITSGSHWSLLVYEKLTNKYFYFDSSNNYNLGSAKKVANKISTFLGGKAIEAEFVALKGPQQTNTWDCGIHVCWLVEAMVYDIITQGSINYKFLQNVVLDESDVISKRSQNQNQKLVY
jgi:hypothetical protein